MSPSLADNLWVSIINPGEEVCKSQHQQHHRENSEPEVVGLQQTKVASETNEQARDCVKHFFIPPPSFHQTHQERLRVG